MDTIQEQMERAKEIVEETLRQMSEYNPSGNQYVLTLHRLIEEKLPVPAGSLWAGTRLVPDPRAEFTCLLELRRSSWRACNNDGTPIGSGPMSIRDNVLFHTITLMDDAGKALCTILEPLGIGGGRWGDKAIAVKRL